MTLVRLSHGILLLSGSRPAWQREGRQADYSFCLDSQGGGGKWLRCCDSPKVPEEQFD